MRLGVLLYLLHGNCAYIGKHDKLSFPVQLPEERPELLRSQLDAQARERPHGPCAQLVGGFFLGAGLKLQLNFNLQVFRNSESLEHPLRHGHDSLSADALESGLESGHGNHAALSMETKSTRWVSSVVNAPTFRFLPISASLMSGGQVMVQVFPFGTLRPVMLWNASAPIMTWAPRKPFFEPGPLTGTRCFLKVSLDKLITNIIFYFIIYKAFFFIHLFTHLSSLSRTVEVILPMEKRPEK